MGVKDRVCDCCGEPLPLDNTRGNDLCDECNDCLEKTQKEDDLDDGSHGGYNLAGDWVNSYGRKSLTRTKYKQLSFKDQLI